MAAILFVYTEFPRKKQILKLQWRYYFEIVLTIIEIVLDDRHKNRLVEIRLISVRDECVGYDVDDFQSRSFRFTSFNSSSTLDLKPHSFILVPLTFGLDGSVGEELLKVVVDVASSRRSKLISCH